MDAFMADNSLLSLFDPLATPPQSPTREAPSPESWSDKENDGPSAEQSPFSAHFNRVYTRPEMGKIQSARLIDLGSPCKSAEPYEDSSDASDDEDTLQDISLLDCYAPRVVGIKKLEPQEERIPLADIKLERAPPQGVAIPATVEEEMPATAPASDVPPQGATDTTTLRPTVSLAPFGTPLADVINSINLGFASLGLNDDPATAAPPSDNDAACENVVCPNITVDPPVSEPPSPASMQPTVDVRLPLLGVDAPPVFSPPARRHVSTSSSDPRRISVDLQSSFSLQLQSPDMSFDLLNDKVPFLSPNQYSWWSGVDEDDTMDVAKEELNMKMTAEQYESIKEEEEIEPMPTEQVMTPPKSHCDIAVLVEHKSPLGAPVFSLPPEDPMQPVEARPVQELAPKPAAAPLNASTTSTLTKSTARRLSTFTRPTITKPHDRASSVSSTSTARTRTSLESSRPSDAYTSRSASRAGSDMSESEVAPPVRTMASAAKSLSRSTSKPLASLRTAGSLKTTMRTPRPSISGLTQSEISATTRARAGSIGNPLARSTTTAPAPRAVAINPTSKSAIKPATTARRTSLVVRPRPAAGATTGVAAAPKPMLRAPALNSSTSSTAETSSRSALPRFVSRLPSLSKATGLKASSALRK